MESKIKTQCPHCEAVYKVPDVYQGKQINCPKCKESFTIQKYKGANKTQQVQHCGHCGRMLQKDERACVYEGQVVCHQCNESLRHPTYVTQTKSVSGLGIAALVLGLIACLGCWIPMCGIFSLPFAILGALFGVIGIIIAKLNKKAYVGLPIAGTIVCATAAFSVIAVTGATVSSIEESSRAISKSLDQIEAPSLDKTEATLGNAGNGDRAKQNREKQAYADKIKIMNLKVAKAVFGDLGVFGEIKNTGNRTLTEVEITIYYLDDYGNTIYEDTFHPILISRWSSDNKPLKPNYTEKFGYGADDVPSEWSKKIKVYITNIEFED